MGGPLSIESALYSTYVVREFVLEYTSAVATTYIGDMALAVEADSGAYSDLATDPQTAVTFTEARMVVPMVTMPYRIPTGQLYWKYEGPLIYTTDFTRLTTSTSMSDIRSQCQFLIKGFDSGLLTSSSPSPVGYCMITVKIEFYNKVAPLSILGSSVAERDSIRAIRSVFRKRARQLRVQPRHGVDEAALQPVLKEVESLIDSLTLRPPRLEREASLEIAAAGDERKEPSDSQPPPFDSGPDPRESALSAGVQGWLASLESSGLIPKSQTRDREAYILRGLLDEFGLTGVGQSYERRDGRVVQYHPGNPQPVKTD